MGEKREWSSDYHGGNHGQKFNKKQRPNGSYAPRRSSDRDSIAGYDNALTRRDGQNGRHNRFYVRDFETRKIQEQIASLPDPKDCQPCKTVEAEMQTGLISILDQLVQEECGPSGNTDIMFHAKSLLTLLSSRADKSRSTRALNSKYPPKSKDVAHPPIVYRKTKAQKHLPPLPPISEAHLVEEVFTHRSTRSAIGPRGFNANELNYERLEFLGDAYIEVIAARLVYSRFPHIEAGQQSQLVESLVKNDSLSKFSDAYNLADRINHVIHLKEGEGNTKWRKILADVFEAYVAALILSDPENGFKTAEEWLTELWAPQLLSYKEKEVENPQAKDQIQKLIALNEIKLEYRMERDMEFIGGKQNFYMGLYLTGWGYNEEWLGSGEGQNKGAASLAAANDALKRSKHILDDCNRQKLERIASLKAEKVKEI